MRRMLAVLVVVAAVVLVAETNAQGGGKKKGDLHGKWTVTEISFGDKKKPIPEGSMTVVFEGNKMTMTKGDQPAEEGTFKLDPSKKPKHIDMTKKGKDETVPGIYEVKGDSLKMGFPKGGPKGERPAGFDAPDIFIIHLKRQK